MSNATKAIVAGLINSGILLAASYGVPVGSPEQQLALAGFLNAGFALFVALTYKRSLKRIPDGSMVMQMAPVPSLSGGGPLSPRTVIVPPVDTSLQEDDFV